MEVKPADLNTIIPSSEVITGCSNPVSFTTNPASGDIFYTPPPGTYSINWQIPGNWSFNGGSSGNTIAVVPNALTVSDVIATLQINNCPYQSSTTLHVFPTTPATSFLSSSVQNICLGTTTHDYSVNAACGASGYTYTLQGNADAVFTANGQKTITTPATTVNVTFPQTDPYQVGLSAVVNYPNGASSTSSGYTIGFGVPMSGGFSYYTSNGLQFGLVQEEAGTNTVCFSRPITSTTAVMNVLNATNTDWTGLVPPGLLWSNGGNNLSITFRTINQSGDFFFTATNVCGALTQEYVFKSVTCSSLNSISQFTVSPNPVSNEITITGSATGTDALSTARQLSTGLQHTGSDVTITISDITGITRKSYHFIKNKNYKLNVSDLAPGLYFITINDGAAVTSHKVLIQK